MIATDIEKAYIVLFVLNKPCIKPCIKPCVILNYKTLYKPCFILNYKTLYKPCINLVLF